jgi:hypothetical protein
MGTALGRFNNPYGAGLVWAAPERDIVHLMPGMVAGVLQRLPALCTGCSDADMDAVAQTFVQRLLLDTREEKDTQEIANDVRAMITDATSLVSTNPAAKIFVRELLVQMCLQFIQGYRRAVEKDSRPHNVYIERMAEKMRGTEG